MSLIPADQDFAVFTAIMVLAGIAFLSERTWLGQKVTGTVVVILLAILAANTGGYSSFGTRLRVYLWLHRTHAHSAIFISSGR